MEFQKKLFGKFGNPLTGMDFFGWFILFGISTGIIVAERFTPLYINNFYVRLVLYILSSSLFVFWISWILFGFKAVKSRNSILFATILVCLAKSLLTWGGDWKTQTILFDSAESDFVTIEYQMRGDRFSFGYKDRIVERRKLIPYFDWINKSDTATIDRTKWIRAGRYVNQLGIKDYLVPSQ